MARALVRANTVNPPGGEEALAAPLGRRLADAGLDVRLQRLDGGRTNVVARSPSLEQRPALCLTGHLDVVPVGDEPWSVDPFGGELAGDRLYGRGSSDMKGGVAAIVAAVERLAGRWDGAEASVEVVLTFGEETGCEGARALVGSDLLGDVGAMVVAEPTANEPRIVHKGVLWLRAETVGQAAHGSAPGEGRNAIYPLAEAVARLADFDFGLPEHFLLGAATLNVGTFHGGANVNSVPDRAAAEIDVRTLPGFRDEIFIDALRRELGPAVSLRPFLRLPPLEGTSGAPFVGDVCDVLEPLLGARPEPAGMAPFTDAAVLKPAYGNPPTVICGPGEPDQAHRTDEWCSTTRIEQAVDAYTEIARRWCAM